MASWSPHHTSNEFMSKQNISIVLGLGFTLLALPVTGSKHELVLPLIHYQCGTAPDDVATPAFTDPSADVPSAAAAAAAKSTAMTPDHRAFMEQMMSQYAVNAAALSTGGIALQNRTTLGRKNSLVSKYISDHLVKLSIQVMLSTRIFSMLWVLNCGTMAVSV